MLISELAPDAYPRPTTAPIKMLEQAYAALHEAGLTTSRSHFSVEWLGNEPNFLTLLCMSEWDVSPDLLDVFYLRLERHLSVLDRQRLEIENENEIVMGVLGEVGAHYAGMVMGLSD